MKLFITEITDMSANNRCIAGWDIDQSKMVRPLLNGTNWSIERIEEHKIEVGRIYYFENLNRKHKGSFPHTTEDTNVSQNNIKEVLDGNFGWFGENAPYAAHTIQEAFDNNVENNSHYQGSLQGLYIPANTKCSSLSAINIDRQNIDFFSNSYKGQPAKLKAKIYDGDKNYTLSVSSSMLKEVFDSDGIKGVNKITIPDGQVHVRLGLARPFNDAADKCNLMINGVYG